jgi:magnesium chelatase family protein
VLSTTESIALIGTDAHLVQVEVHVAVGVPRFTIVGLPAASVREAEQRTRSAILSTSEQWPAARIVANLAPGSLRKEGTHFDLPIALGILAANDRLEPGVLDGWISVGELALNGSLRPVRGALAAAMECRKAGRRGLICPATNAPEAKLVEGIEVVPVATLREAIDFLKGEWTPLPVPPIEPLHGDAALDVRDVRGHPAAKRALEIAAAGGHNVLMVGPPGVGKTMLASRLPGILPPMSLDESLEATRVYSVAGLLAERPALVTERPFRVPHHHISPAGLVGGGAGIARPGEISLAHLGILFLDELALYRRDVLETLRAPLEEGVVRIARSGGVVAYPCRFSLVAAMNPCPCGYYGDAQRECRCSELQLSVYWSKLSGPLVDRFDMQVTMARLNKGQLLRAPEGEDSAVVRRRVEAARAIQQARYGSPVVTNASKKSGQLDRSIGLSDSARRMITDAIEPLRLTGRGVDRIVRVARTIADLATKDVVDEEHVAEALSFRLSTVGAEAAA